MSLWNNLSFWGCGFITAVTSFYNTIKVINDIFLCPTVFFVSPFIAKILVFAKVVLQVAVGYEFLTLEVIKGDQQVTHLQDRAKEHDEVFLILLANDLRLRNREIRCQVADHISVARMLLAVIILITIIVIFEAPDKDNAARILVAKQGDCGIHPLRIRLVRLKA